MTIAADFHKRLGELDIELDIDTLDYITGMLDDLDLASGAGALREATEEFLLDANVPKSKLDALYNPFTDNSNSTRSAAAPASIAAVRRIAKIPDVVATPPPPEEKSTTESAVTEEKDSNTTTKKKAAARGRRKGATAAKAGAGNGTGTEQDEPTIVAISQQSRFHTETLETSSTEIDLPGVNITVNQVDLLIDAHLRLKSGVRYGLVGQNGVGKTVLMRCMADNILVGLPQNVNILHVAQLQVSDENKTILDEVLSADSESMNAIQEAEILQKVASGGAHEAAAAPTAALNRVVHSIMLARSQEKLDLANKIATKRSGARGRDARRELVICEQAHADLASKDPQSFVTAEITNSVVAEVYERASLVDLGALKSKAQKILRGIGFSDEQITMPVSKFSGGWRMRMALAKALFMEPDILLLDEPTNHLDLPAILWLQEYLNTSTEGFTVVIVSHDRAFLDAVTDETIIFKEKQLKYHAGNYEDWERNTEEQRTRKQGLLDAQERKRKQIMASMQHNLARAKASGDDKRHGMVNSRKKKLDRLGMEKTEDGKRFKQSYRAGYHTDMREKIVIEQAVKTAKIKIPDPPPLRYHGPIFSLKEVSFRYTKDGPLLVDNVSMNIELGSRLCLLGANGSGKSTLLNVMAGRLSPTRGEVYRHPKLRLAYFSQHAVDELDADKTPVEIMMERFSITNEGECRAHLGSVGLSGGVVLRPVRSLSGGQRNRVALAFLLYEAPHVLILDEITNHLDMGTVEMLVEALSGYAGALVLVSHDVWFLKQLMEPDHADDDQDDDYEEEDHPGQFYVCKPNQRMKPWDKGLDAYVDSVMTSVRKKHF